MYEWSDEHRAIAAVVRRFVDEEIRPQLDDLEFGDLRPYGILRKMFETFGMKAMAEEGFQRQLERKIKGDVPSGDRRSDGAAGATLIPIIELCKVSLGLVTSMGVSTGLAGGTIMKLAK